MSVRVVLLHRDTCWQVALAAQAAPAPQLASLAPLHTPGRRRMHGLRCMCEVSRSRLRAVWRCMLKARY